MKKKILTISIAAYNVEEYIGHTLESLILPTTYMDLLDVIIVDDGSKDRTAEIAYQYSQRFPNSMRVIKKTNGGYGSTINASLPLAKGTFYKLLDGDDWYQTEHLCEYLDFLLNVEQDLVISPYLVINENNGETILRHNRTNMPTKVENNELWTLLEEPTMWELAIRTDCLRIPPLYIQESCFYTDTEFIFECLYRAKGFERYKDSIYCYRIGREGQSVSIENTRKHYRDWIRVTSKLYQRFEKLLSTLKKDKQQQLIHVITNATWGTINAFLLQEKPMEKRMEIMCWNQKMREECPVIYHATSCERKIRYLRNSRFLLLPIYAWIKKQKCLK